MKKHKIEFTGKTMYVPLSVYPGSQDTRKNLIVSVPGVDQVRTSLTDNGLAKLKKYLLDVYNKKKEEYEGSPQV
ncbi:MAG: hypothetical protein ABIJ27_02235 [Candidatus Omnitrophota bacterium]